MPVETKEKISDILSQVALLAAACEGNMYHDHTITNEAIYNQCIQIQEALVKITE